MDDARRSDGTTAIRHPGCLSTSSQESLRRLDRKDVARAMGVHWATLRAWELKGPPATLGAQTAAAWELALGREAGTVLGGVHAGETGSGAAVPVMADAGETVEQVIRRLAAATRPAAAKFVNERNVTVFVERYGVGQGAIGRPVDLARRHNVTQSRVTQIVRRMLDLIKTTPTDHEPFLRLQKVVEASLPCEPARLETVTRPILGAGPTIGTAVRFAQNALGLALPILDAYLAPGSVPHTDPEPERRFREMANAMITAVGAAHLGVLMAQALEIGWPAEQVLGMRACVAEHEGHEWLDESDDGKAQWFWYGGSVRNPIVDTARKVFSVAEGPVAFDSLAAALERVRRDRLGREERRSLQFPIPTWRVTQRVLGSLPFLERAAEGYGAVGGSIQAVNEPSKVEHQVGRHRSGS
ncbi:hypothetical protein [Paraburkholderia youngii]|uniref:hypothetical protein n=1 Tax=Paraburkholderia youngii TaxID=2782701 RepID=UPI003D1B7E6C